MANPREINRALVDAQEARRILDRLYGYDVSTVLWKKVQRGLSAGRVQSVATRIVVERERQRMKFRSAEYWDILAKLLPENDTRSFNATLHRARRRPHRHRSRLRPGDRQGPAQRSASCTSTRAAPAGWPPGSTAVRSRSPGSRRSRTGAGRTRRSSPRRLQQESARKLRLSSAQTMRIAQRLYENGYITYMRTDSVNLSESAIAAARQQIRRPVRGRRRSAAAPPVHRQGQERPGGARGDPPGRRHLPDPRRGGQGAVRRGVPALRADLAADHRLADDRRRRQQHLGADQRGDHRRRSRATSAPPARRSPTPASCAPTSSPPTTRTPRPRTPSAGCRCWSRTSR